MREPKSAWIYKTSHSFIFCPVSQMEHYIYESLYIEHYDFNQVKSAVRIIELGSGITGQMEGPRDPSS